MRVSDAGTDVGPQFVPAVGIEQGADANADVPRTDIRDGALSVRFGDAKGDVGPEGQPIRGMPDHADRRGDRDGEPGIAFVLRPRAGRRETPEGDSDYAHLPSRHCSLSFDKLLLSYTRRWNDLF